MSPPLKQKNTSKLLMIRMFSCSEIKIFLLSNSRFKFCILHLKHAVLEFGLSKNIISEGWVFSVTRKTHTASQYVSLGCGEDFSSWRISRGSSISTCPFWAPRPNSTAQKYGIFHWPSQRTVTKTPSLTPVDLCRACLLPLVPKSIA